MKSLNISTFAVLSFFTFAFQITGTACFAGAWTLPKGKAYVKLSANVYDSEEQFDSEGKEKDFPGNGSFKDRNLGLYAEYGLTDTVGLVFSGSYKSLEKKSDPVTQTFDGLSDMDLAVKYRLADNRMGVVSVQALVKVPEAYDDDEVLLPGNAQYDYEIRLMAGRSLYPAVPGYVNVEAAYRLRDKAPADEMRFLGEFGLDFLKKGFVRFKVESLVGMDNADQETNTENPNLSADFDLVKLSMTLGCRVIGIWGVELETIREVAGENVSKGNTVSASVTCSY